MEFVPPLVPEMTPATAVPFEANIRIGAEGFEFPAEDVPFGHTAPSIAG